LGRTLKEVNMACFKVLFLGVSGGTEKKPIKTLRIICDFAKSLTNLLLSKKSEVLLLEPT
jgi:hypothetical protein